MNPKQLKRLRKKAKEILLSFVRESIKLDDYKNITDDKIDFLIKNPSYEWKGTTLYLQEWCYRWIIKQFTVFNLLAFAIGIDIHPCHRLRFRLAVK